MAKTIIYNELALQVRNQLITGGQHGRFTRISQSYAWTLMGKNGNEIEWDTSGTNEQGYDLGLSRNYVYDNDNYMVDDLGIISNDICLHSHNFERERCKRKEHR